MYISHSGKSVYRVERLVPDMGPGRMRVQADIALVAQQRGQLVDRRVIGIQDALAVLPAVLPRQAQADQMMAEPFAGRRRDIQFDTGQDQKTVAR